MAKLKQLIDPFDQVDPYPTFGIWSDASLWGTVINSELYPIGTFRAATSQEMWAASAGAASTSTILGTGSGSLIQSTVINQAEGNQVLDIGPRNVGGIARSIAATPLNVGNIWAKFGVVIGERGVRQKISLWHSDTDIALYMRGGTQIELVSTTGLRNATGEPGAQGFGQICYNDRTGTLMLITSAASSTNYRAHVWVNPRRSLNSALVHSGALRTFISEAFNGTNGASYYYNDFSWSTSGATARVESWRRVRVILGDNGKVGLFRHTTSTQAIWASITLNPAGTTATATAISNATITTTQDYDTAAYLGCRTNITWDNEWVAAYCQYANYGTGIVVAFFYTKDPSIVYHYTNTASGNSASGVGIVPISENRWLISEYQNSDGGALMQLRSFDPAGCRANGRNVDGTSIATTGGQITATTNINGNFDVSGTTTNYPAVVAMSHWWGR